MIQVSGLSKRFSGRIAVDDLDFAVIRGEVTGYLGVNGSGKSTTAKILTGLLSPCRGEIAVDGLDVRKDLKGFKRRVGYVPEEPLLYPYLTGPEYLQLSGRLRGIREKNLNERIAAFMELFGLKHHWNSQMCTYSKGMRQKILISAALIHNPDVLIFDEPLSGLDVGSMLVFRHLIRRLAAGRAILFSSHVLEVVERICTRVIVLHHGRIVARETVVNLRDTMKLPSLEDVFAQLVQQPDPDKSAEQLVGAMTL